MARDAAEVELLAAKALIAKARSEQSAVDIARQRLDDTSIRVPAGFSGAAAHFRIAERMVAAGEFMTEGRAMFRLVATDPIRFRANVPERFAGAIAVGQSAALWLEGAQEVGAVATSGSVARIAPRIDEKSRSFEVEIVVANPTGRLKPGAFARGSIEIRRDPRRHLRPGRRSRHLRRRRSRLQRQGRQGRRPSRAARATSRPGAWNRGRRGRTHRDRRPASHRPGRPARGGVLERERPGHARRFEVTSETRMSVTKPSGIVTSAG